MTHSLGYTYANRTRCHRASRLNPSLNPLHHSW